MRFRSQVSFSPILDAHAWDGFRARMMVEVVCLCVHMSVCACTWWRHQTETFSALQGLYAGNSVVTGEFPAQRPVTQSFDIFFELRLNKRLSKQSWGYDLRRHRAYYDVTVMCAGWWWWVMFSHFATWTGWLLKCTTRTYILYVVNSRILLCGKTAVMTQNISRRRIRIEIL